MLGIGDTVVEKEEGGLICSATMREEVVRRKIARTDLDISHDRAAEFPPFVDNVEISCTSHAH